MNRLINHQIEPSSGALVIEREKPAAIKKIPAAEYHSIVALSNSGMRDLAVSPLRFWHLNINPNRPVREETPEQKFGTALHCLVLEGAKTFNERYAPMLNPDDHSDCLVTIEDLRNYLRDKGCAPKGTRKADVIAQVQAIEPNVPIWDVLEAEHEKATQGKMLCLPEDWTRLHGCANALLAEPKIQDFLYKGEPEVSLILTDADGIPVKARLDWIHPLNGILDLKTFTQKRGKSIDQSIADAIFWEKYYIQAYWYSTLHQQAVGASKTTKLCMAFAESEEPHEVRIKEMRPFAHGVANVWWQRAQIECRHFKQVWADHMREFGEKPWRRAQEIDPLEDMELKALAFS